MVDVSDKGNETSRRIANFRLDFANFVALRRRITRFLYQYTSRAMASTAAAAFIE